MRRRRPWSALQRQPRALSDALEARWAACSTWQACAQFAPGPLSPALSVRCSRAQPTLAAAVFEDGGVHVLRVDLERRDLLVAASAAAHDNAVFDCAFDSSHLLATASADQTLAVLDVAAELADVTVLSRHTGTVKSCCFGFTRPLLASCGRDGNVFMWDLREPAHPRPTAALLGVHAPEKQRAPGFSRTSPAHRASRTAATSTGAAPGSAAVAASPSSGASVTCVQFSRTDDLLLTAGSDGYVKAWDLRANRKPVAQFGLKQLGPRAYGVASLSVSACGAYVSAATLGSRAHVFSMYDDSVPPVTLDGIPCTSFYSRSAFADNPLDERAPAPLRFAAAGSDGALHVFDAPTLNAAVSEAALLGARGSASAAAPVVRPRWRIGGLHSSEVCGVAWCPADPSLVLTSGEDGVVRLIGQAPRVDSSDDFLRSSLADLPALLR